MLVVKVELWSAVTGAKTEIARMALSNVGVNESGTLGDYEVAALRGRTKQSLAAATVKWVLHRKGATKIGKVEKHPRKAQHVWNLVQKALTSMGYGA